MREVGEWLRRLLEVLLTDQMLYDAVAVKHASYGSLDSWSYGDFKALPVAWFDGLAAILRVVEQTHDWPDSLLDVYMLMIPETGGDAAPLGQRPLGA